METVQHDYKQILQRIVAEIKSSRIQVARKITSATMELYWNIGKELSAQHLSKGYGAQVVEMLASDLQKEFPGTTGFMNDIAGKAGNCNRALQFYLGDTTCC